MLRVSRTTCAIVGGGPAGVVLGLLLARAGVEVQVLEKHDDFNRDFRGDTVHAATIRLLDELGLGDAFRAIPQSRLDDFALPMPDGSTLTLGEFERLSPPYDHVALVPQWDLLDMLAASAAEEPTFTLRMGVEASGVIVENGVVTGVHLHPHRSEPEGRGSGEDRPTSGEDRPASDEDRQRPDGDPHAADGHWREELRADLVVACDGRWSDVRRSAGLDPVETPVPFDTWWFRLPRHDGDAERSLVPAFHDRDVLLSFPRRDYHQVAYFAPKGSDARLRAEGVASFRRRVAALRPDFADRVDAISTMDDVHVLDVHLNRLRRWWRSGLLCIGDAAHAMSPAGGVGINLAVQDAVATAASAAAALLRAQEARASEARTNVAESAGSGSAASATAAGAPIRRALDAASARVQRRRLPAAVIVQTAQRALHRAVFQRAFAGELGGAPPGIAVFLARHVPPVRGLYARGVAFGPRPEHAPEWARR